MRRWPPPDARPHVVTSALEHAAVLDPCRRIARAGADVTVLDAEPSGVVSADAVADAITEATVLVSIMAVNNELGTANPMPSIASVCRERGVPLHCDAVQAAALLPGTVASAAPELVSVSAHKMHGPQGCGALIARGLADGLGRPGTAPRLQPLIEGGGHEHGLRSGTLNVAGIVGLGAACAICLAESAAHAARIEGQRERLEGLLREACPGAVVHGEHAPRAPHILNIGFAVAGPDPLAERLAGLACSSGAACSSGRGEPSHVLRAIGVPADRIAGSIRLSLSRFTTDEEVVASVEIVRAAVNDAP